MTDDNRFISVCRRVAAALVAAGPAELDVVLDQVLADLGRAVGGNRAHLFLVRPGERLDIREWNAPGVESVVSLLHAVPPETIVAWTDTLVDDTALLLDLHDYEETEGGYRDFVIGLGMAEVLTALVRTPSATGTGLLVFSGDVGQIGAEARDRELIALLGEVVASALGRASAERRLAAMTEELRRRNAELERVNTDLETFAHAAAHDLKSPLSTVRMTLQTLGRLADGGDAMATQLIGVATRSADRMEVLIEDLLRYALTGVDHRDTVDVDLDDVVRDAVADCSATISESGADVAVDVTGAVVGDPTELRLLFQNLLANALKFRRPDTSPRIVVSVSHADGGIEIVVADDGIGVPEDQREAVFDPFTRLHGREEFEGTGIGLATCRRIVDRHDGTIWLTESEAGGAAVHVQLPLRDGDLSAQHQKD